MKQKWIKALKGDVGRLLVLVAVFALFAILVKDGRFLSRGNVENILVHSTVVGVAAIGATLVILSAGIDLSVGSVLALSVVAIARMLPDSGPAPDGFQVLLALAMGVGVGVLCGLVNGALITAVRMVPFVVTLATLQIFRGLASGLAGEQNVYTQPSWLDQLLDPVYGSAGRGWMLVPPGVWIMLICGVLVWAMLRYTRLGRHVVAVGSNEETARLCGVAVSKVKLAVYGLAGLFAGIAGVMQYSYVGMGQPTTGQGYELQVIAAVVIGGGSLKGGEGSVAGALIGTLIIRVLFAGCVLMGWPNWIQTVVTGAIIALAVAVDRMRHRMSDATPVAA